MRTESEPLKGVYVLTTGPEQLRAVRTDGQGRFQISGTTPGVYRVRMQKPEDASAARSRTVRLAPGVRIEGFDLIVPKGAVIAGRIRDRSGQPVAGVLVVAYDQPRPRAAWRLVQQGIGRSDDRGEYRIAHLPAGAYLVAATTTLVKQHKPELRPEKPPAELPPAYPPVTFAPSGRIPEAAAVIEVAAGQERLGVDVEMEKVPVHCVFVRPSGPAMDAGEPVQVGLGLNLWLGARGPGVGSGQVTPGSDWQICGVPSGEYMLDLVGYVKRNFRGVGFGQAMVRVGKQHEDAGEVQVLGFQSLKGRVTVRGEKKGQPLPPGIRLVLQLRQRDLLFSDTLQGLVAADGAFDLARVYPGTYGLRLENLPAGHYVTRMEQGGLDIRQAGARPDSGPVTIELGADGPSLTGLVSLDEKGTPAAEASVFLVAARDGRVLAAQSDEGGRYTFENDLEPGEYKLVAVAGLPEAQRTGEQAALRVLAGAVSIRLPAGAQSVRDLIAARNQ
ncbi:carboxypeptidase regulatory-like domain-containing protein [Paludibaculum fermentans]|uniref:carboxypeptidase regulatory-like domain-containing protein n=1 Tax=Paludibaculum fermentans TaxID=1473598 RepID=UPI003EBA29E3